VILSLLEFALHACMTLTSIMNEEVDIWNHLHLHHQHCCMREEVAYVLNALMTYFQDGNLKAIELLFSEDVEYSKHKRTWRGRSNVLYELQRELDTEVIIYKKREIIDRQQCAAAMEAVIRIKDSVRSGYQEHQIAWMVMLNSDLSIQHWQAWTDPVWHTYINTLETPLPQETWQPSEEPGVGGSREDVGRLIESKVHAYQKEDLEAWGNTVHDEIIIHPPWDCIIGGDCCRKAVDVYFQNYKNTIITPIRLLFDEEQPHFAVYQQTFQTTNKSTGQQGKDDDFVFLEVAQGKIRYWRTYFDTDQSVQTQAQTFRGMFSVKPPPVNARTNNNKHAK